jgi:bifunctional non-homologous end joining protein LigD
MVRKAGGRMPKKSNEMPQSISPMLCTLTKEVPDRDDYIYEIKWDGYRIISYSDISKVRLASRSGLDYTHKYPPVAAALKALGHDVILDGEVVVFNSEGNPDFDAVQLYNGHDTPIQYCVFDLLWMDGHNLMELPLTERKSLLQMVVKDSEVLRFSESFEDGKALYDKILERNLEGIVAKRKDSPYLEGDRGNDWLKVPTRKRQEFVIGGWAESDKARSFRSLLFGAYESGKLQWIGRSGGGYKEKEMPGILKKLKALEIEKSPFQNKVLDTKGAVMHWIKPELVANFEFATWTKTGRIRKPATFLGFRLDKKPKQVVREVPKPMDKIENEVDEEEEGEQNETEIDVTSKDESNADKELEKYYHKRRFDKTPEPKGGKADKEKLVFVIQKHAASHLHYDFRLEMRGVLKSWAVPKGPSMNPEDHRLAMAVEDHPYDYKDFEGIIPEGQYGGGTVIIWDQGSYEPAEPVKGKKAQEHWLLSHYYKGSLSIVLKGEKLKGKFNLSRIRERGETSWLLTKAEDGKQLKRDITKKDKSVVSGLSIEAMSKNSGAAVWQSNRADKQTDKQMHNEALAIEEGDQEKKIELKTVGELYPTKTKLTVTSNWKKIFKEKITSTATVEIDGNPVVLTNVERHVWKDIPKAALIQYYHSIADTILPYLKDRPLSLHIKPYGANAEGLYIKDIEGMEPEGAEIFPDKRRHPKQGKRKMIDYLVCNNESTLLYLINLGCIDLNPWMSRTGSSEEPDFINIDLDPTKEDFDKVIAVALAAKKVLAKYKLKSFVKTSGKTGLHIYIPVAGISFAEARDFSERLGAEINELVPDISTTEVTISHRKDKVFIDPSQNDYADTLASAYSSRPYHLPTVSTPLDWKEVKRGLDPSKFTIYTVPGRLKKKGDLFKEALNPKWAIANAKKLASM